jgi:hypothetical protein
MVAVSASHFHRPGADGCQHGCVVLSYACPRTNRAVRLDTHSPDLAGMQSVVERPAGIRVTSLDRMPE